MSSAEWSVVHPAILEFLVITASEGVYCVQVTVASMTVDLGYLEYKQDGPILSLAWIIVIAVIVGAVVLLIAIIVVNVVVRVVRRMRRELTIITSKPITGA